MTEFNDFQDLSKEHLDEYNLFKKEQLDGLVSGHIIKVCAEDTEIFWAVVQSVDGENITAVVDNDVVDTDIHGLKNGDVFKCEKRHVYRVWLGMQSI